MLFLTYHRICSASEAGRRDFYTVTDEELAGHLDLLHARGFYPGRLDALLAGEHDDRAFFITFDDGTLDHFTLAAPLLEARGMHGIFFIPTEKIDGLGRLDGVQVRHLAAMGHELGCHAHEHRRLDTQSEVEIAEQLDRSCRILAGLSGVSPRILAPPGGFSSGVVRRVAASAGLRIVRTMDWGLNRSLRLDALETIPLNRKLTLNRLGKILDGHGLVWLRTLYFGKQTLKTFLPLRFYERLRKALFCC